MNPLKLFCSWRVMPEGDISQADSIIVHAGSETVNRCPGAINVALAKLIGTLPHLPLIAQGDVSSAIGVGIRNWRERQIFFPPQNSPEDRRRLWFQSLGVPFAPYIETVHVALGHLKALQELGLSRPIMVSYYPHVIRAVWVTRKLGLTPVVLPKYPHVYEPEAAQRWMRSPWRNFPRELLARLREYRLGRI